MLSVYSRRGICLKASKDIRESVNRSRVVVSVYYEALCPDSRSFFLRHLLPTYLRMPNAIQVELVPYGKAVVCN